MAASLAALLLAVAAQPTPAARRGKARPAAEEREGPPTVAEKTRGLERREGLLPTWLDRRSGKIWLELPPGQGGEVGRYLYVEGLVRGLGSNPVSLDRGQLGPTRVIVLRRLGGRLLVEQPNLGFRALTDNPLESRAVAESFATSVLWGGEIAALDADGRALVDFTPFVVRDAHGAAARLERTGQGTFTLDATRSAIDLDACLAFPDNLEFEALLTFAGSAPGGHVREVTPTPQSITLVQHHSILRLPDDGYRPRRFDPRAGSFYISFLDYAAPLDRSIERRWIVRHRLEKTDPAAERSPVREPIVYYVDRGAPEPVRSALVEGASWWARAFERAGFLDAFRVELLPEDVHPLDARHNVIQWVHRSTRGWSYGGGVIDPRSGEMVKGHVSLGSLRVRQDRLLFEGLLGTGATGSGRPDDPLELALARIRQLAAHEVGHTLGLTHNFAASTYADRASVMDYPAPRIGIRDDGSFDVSRAYGVGVGEWDVQAIRYAYAQFPAGTDEDAVLDAIVRDGLERGLVFLADADARPAGAAHPLANLWDNGSDPVAELRQVLQVRRLALERFGQDRVVSATPLALLQEVLVPVYFHHRYQLAAAVKVLGGMRYAYAVRGDGQPPARPVAGARQRAALLQVLAALDPEQLDIPDRVIEWILPRPFGHGRNRELFPTNTSPAFDPLSAAAAAAGAVLDGLLQPERCNRLVDFHRRDRGLPGIGEVLEALLEKTFRARPDLGERHAVLHRLVQTVTVERLVTLAADERAGRPVRAAVEAKLADLADWLETPPPAGADAPEHRRSLRGTIRRFLDRQAAPADEVAEAPALPPGDPIGSFRAAGRAQLPPPLAGCSLD